MSIHRPTQSRWWTGGLLAVVALTLAVGAAAASPARAAEVNTFQGTCTGYQAIGHWPQPMRLESQRLYLYATFEGGSCNGILNGTRISNTPIRDGTFDANGTMSCIAGLGTGRASFTIGGRRFTGSVRYQRPLSAPVVVISGDAGGQYVGVTRVSGGLPEYQALLESCSSTGVSQLTLDVNSAAPISISSPAE